MGNAVHVVCSDPATSALDGKAAVESVHAQLMITITGKTMTFAVSLAS